MQLPEQVIEIQDPQPPPTTTIDVNSVEDFWNLLKNQIIGINGRANFEKFRQILNNAIKKIDAIKVNGSFKTLHHYFIIDKYNVDKVIEIYVTFIELCIDILATVVKIDKRKVKNDFGIDILVEKIREKGVFFETLRNINNSEKYPFYDIGEMSEIDLSRMDKISEIVLPTGYVMKSGPNIRFFSSGYEPMTDEIKEKFFRGEYTLWDQTRARKIRKAEIMNYRQIPSKITGFDENMMADIKKKLTTKFVNLIQVIDAYYIELNKSRQPPKNIVYWPEHNLIPPNPKNENEWKMAFEGYKKSIETIIDEFENVIGGENIYKDWLRGNPDLINHFNILARFANWIVSQYPELEKWKEGKKSFGRRLRSSRTQIDADGDTEMEDETPMESEQEEPVDNDDVMIVDEDEDYDDEF